MRDLYPYDWDTRIGIVHTIIRFPAQTKKPQHFLQQETVAVFTAS